jgi:predicted DNA-binding antitoxin AbrB/MazE fold protein
MSTKSCLEVRSSNDFQASSKNGLIPQKVPNEKSDRQQMRTIRAIYENGVFRPLQPVDFPEGSRVELHNLRIIAVEPGQDLEAAQRMLEQAMRSQKRDAVQDSQ